MNAKHVCLYAIRRNQRPNDLLHDEDRVSLASQRRSERFTVSGMVRTFLGVIAFLCSTMAARLWTR